MKSSTSTLACLAVALVLHAAGALLAWTAYLSVPADPVVSDRPPELPGQKIIERLSGAGSAHAPPLEPVEPYRPPETDVVITPTKAHIAERTYVAASTDVLRPTPQELAMVDRFMRTPPPAEMERHRPAVAEAASPQAAALRPPQLPRRQPALKVPLQRVDMPSSAPQAPSVGRERVTLPRRLDNRPPVYPAQAVLARQQGTVLLRLLVEASGEVGEIEVLSSSGHPVLDAEAVQAVRTWRFFPATRDGRPVPHAVRLPVRFTLE